MKKNRFRAQRQQDVRNRGNQREFIRPDAGLERVCLNACCQANYRCDECHRHEIGAARAQVQISELRLAITNLKLQYETNSGKESAAQKKDLMGFDDMKSESSGSNVGAKPMVTFPQGFSNAYYRADGGVV